MLPGGDLLDQVRQMQSRQSVLVAHSEGSIAGQCDQCGRGEALRRCEHPGSFVLCIYASSQHKLVIACKFCSSFSPVLPAGSLEPASTAVQAC